MANYQELRVKLKNKQLNKLISAAINKDTNNTKNK